MRPVVQLSAVIAVAGCAAPVNDAPSLSGLWGGNFIELTAPSNAVLLNHGCYLETFPGPVFLSPSGTFIATGKVTESSVPYQVGQAAQVRGTIVGDTLTIAASLATLGTSNDWATTETIKLARGQRGTFPNDLQCLE
jgi:hypothetical protein